MANTHLVILKQPYLDAILRGTKTIESRFARGKQGYFDRVRPGDTLFLKASAGPVCARAVAGAVERFEDLTPGRVAAIRQRYGGQIGGSVEYWDAVRDCRFALLVRLKEVRPIEPVRIRKKDWRAWVVLNEKESFGLPVGGP